MSFGKGASRLEAGKSIRQQIKKRKKVIKGKKESSTSKDRGKCFG